MPRLPFAAFALALSACSPAAPKQLAVQDAWVRLPAVPGRPAAAYFTLHGGASPDRLVRIDSPKAARIELHEGKMAGGMMTMHPLAGVDVPAGGTASFTPGGSHAMLFGIAGDVRPGGVLPLTLHFTSGALLKAEAHAVAAGDPAPGS